jgi:hypothetical protein
MWKTLCQFWSSPRFHYRLSDRQKGRGFSNSQPLKMASCTGNQVDHTTRRLVFNSERVSGLFGISGATPRTPTKRLCLLELR